MGVWSTIRAQWQRESSAIASDAPSLRPLPAPYLDADELTADDGLDADDPVLACAIRALETQQHFAQAGTALDDTFLDDSVRRIETAAQVRGWTVTRLAPAGRWRDPLDVEMAMAELTDPAAQGRRHLWLISDLHRAFVRVPGTAAAITRFLEHLLTLRGTNGAAVWIGCRQHAWQRLTQWRGADAAFDAVNAVKEASSMALAERLWALHQTSGTRLTVSTQSDGRNAATVEADALKPLCEWVQAARGVCGGHPARLVAMAREHAGLDEDGAIVLRAADAPRAGTLTGLSYPQRYLLMEVLVHGHLNLDELAEIFVCPAERIAADLAVLQGWQLLEADDAGYRVPPMRAAWVARRLSALQTLE